MIYDHQCLIFRLLGAFALGAPTPVSDQVSISYSSSSGVCRSSAILRKKRRETQAHTLPTWSTILRCNMYWVVLIDSKKLGLEIKQIQVVDRYLQRERVADVTVCLRVILMISVCCIPRLYKELSYIGVFPRFRVFGLK